MSSVFVPGPVPADLPRTSKVLVLASDSQGMLLADRLLSEGFEVSVCLDSEFNADSPATVFDRSRLLKISGFAGAFDVVLDTPGGAKSDRVGWIVSAQQPRLVPKFTTYGLQETDTVISLSRFRELLDTPDAFSRRSGRWFHLAALVGLKGDSQPSGLASLFDLLDKVNQLPDVQAYVFTRHMNVAAAGLERRYRQSRKQGNLFFRFEGPVVEFLRDPDGLALVFQDEQLGSKLELRPDLLVVDEEWLPPLNLEPIFEAMPAGFSCAPFLQPESPRSSGVYTLRAGILCAGASRGVFDSNLASTDIDAVVSAIKKRHPVPDAVPGLSAPKVDPSRCAICLTCVRLCPHGAIGFADKAQVDDLSCARCGICAAECPMSAISAPAPLCNKDGSVDEHIHPEREYSGRIVAFLCERSAADALDAAGGGLCERLCPVKVPCAGSVSASRILDAFEKGAGAVLVAGCFKGNCASVYGTVLGEGRLAEMQQQLMELGINPARAMFMPVASNTPGLLIEAVRELEQTLGRVL